MGNEGGKKSKNNNKEEEKFERDLIEWFTIIGK